VNPPSNSLDGESGGAHRRKKRPSIRVLDTDRLWMGTDGDSAGRDDVPGAQRTVVLRRWPCVAGRAGLRHHAKRAWAGAGRGRRVERRRVHAARSLRAAAAGA